MRKYDGFASSRTVGGGIGSATRCGRPAAAAEHIGHVSHVPNRRIRQKTVDEPTLIHPTEDRSGHGPKLSQGLDILVYQYVAALEQRRASTRIGWLMGTCPRTPKLGLGDDR